MKYLDARKKIRSGDVLAWTHHGWRSYYDLQIQMVRLGQRSEYSHIGVAWRVAGRVFVLEAVSSGIRIFPLSKSGDFYHITTKAKFDKTAEEISLSRVGEKYSKLEALKAFFGKLVVGKNFVWQCAEYVLYVLKAAGVNIKSKATPSAVVQELLLAGGELTFVEGNK